MELSKEEKIKKYHYEEILLILFVCASDLSKYNEHDLIFFAEAIEGRVDVLFEPDYLKGLNKFFSVDKDILEDFDRLRSLLIAQYASQWHKKMRNQPSVWQNANLIAKKILNELNINYVDPIFFSDNYLDID